MDEQERLLVTSLLAGPDDWVTRSVLADWCEEQGQCARADRIRSRLCRPFQFATKCAKCEGGLVEMANEEWRRGMPDLEVSREVPGRGVVYYRRCKSCNKTGRVGNRHSEAWLTGMPCADEWLVANPGELRAMLGMEEGTPTPANAGWTPDQQMWLRHHDDEPLELNVGGIQWRGRMSAVTMTNVRNIRP